MKLKDKKVGFVLTGSFCTFKNTIAQIENIIKEGAEVIPIMSYNAYNLDTKFGNASDFIKQIEDITQKKIIHTIQDAEPIGPKQMTDIMVVAPTSRKYDRKGSRRNYGYTCSNGSKITFEKSEILLF